MASPTRSMLDYYLVLDFEATCDDRSPPVPQEIIEFPVLKVNASSLETESVFHTYVLPVAHPKLTPFCTQLTGITQDQVDGQPTLPEALKNFHAWMEANGLLDPSVTFSFVTCGDWDLKTMLPRQCGHFNIPTANYFHRWINIKVAFQKLTGKKAKGMISMLDYFGLSLDGRHHSGIDDSRNIAKVLKKLAEIDKVILPTTTLPSYKM